MELKEWTENVNRYPVLKWLMAILLLVAGIFTMKQINHLIYGENGADPVLNYIAIYFIVGYGYSHWAATFAAAIPFRYLFEWLWKMIVHAFANNGVNDKATTDITKSVFTEERSIKACLSIRNGTKAFFKAGIWIGIIAWVTTYFFTGNITNFWGACALGLVYTGWGYGWYRLGWYGLLPLPNFDSDGD